MATQHQLKEVMAKTQINASKRTSSGERPLVRISICFWPTIVVYLKPEINVRKKISISSIYSYSSISNWLASSLMHAHGACCHFKYRSASRSDSRHMAKINNIMLKGKRKRLIKLLRRRRCSRNGGGVIGMRIMAPHRINGHRAATVHRVSSCNSSILYNACAYLAARGISAAASNDNGLAQSKCAAFSAAARIARRSRVKPRARLGYRGGPHRNMAASKWLASCVALRRVARAIGARGIIV